MSDDQGKKSSNGARQCICTCLTIFLLLSGVTALTVWLVYRPHTPRFTVVGAAVYGLNLTAPPLITAVLQFTIVGRNPNKRVSIYYDRLSATVAYRGEPITPPTRLPPLFHHRRSTVALSPILGGGPVTVSPEVARGLAADEGYGVVGLEVALVGRLRWKAGAIRTAHHGVNVRCRVLVGLRKGVAGQAPVLGGAPECNVDV